MAGSYDRPLYRRSVLGSFYFKTEDELRKGRNKSGVTVTESTALNYSAFWAANSLICDTLATLPRKFDLFTNNGSFIPTPEHPAAYVWADEPNSAMDGITFHSMMLFWCINWGNSYAIKEMDGEFGRIKHLWPIHPSRFVECKLVNGRKKYKFRINDIGEPQEFDQDAIFHVVGKFSKDGLVGQGILSNAAESLGISIAADQYAAAYYGQGVHSGMFIKTDGTLSDKAYARMKADWVQRGGLKNAHQPLILEQGGELKQLFLPADQVQLLQSRNYNVSDTARWFNVPLHLLRVAMEKSGEATDSENKHFKIHTLQPWAVRYETAYKMQCLGRKDRYRYRATFDFDALLRSDAVARSQENREYWSIGVRTGNEIKKRLGENPYGPDGDIRFVPENMTTIEGAKQKAELAVRQIELDEKAQAEKPAAPNDNKLDPANAPDGQKSNPTKMSGSMRVALLMVVKNAGEDIASFERNQIENFLAMAGEDKNRLKNFPREVGSPLYSMILPTYAVGSLQKSLSPILAAGYEFPDGLYEKVVEPYIRLRSTAIEVCYEKQLSDFPVAVRSTLTDDRSEELTAFFEQYLDAQ
jgi:HK97 family phage portal protein